jgi:hypothetical protein
MTTSRVIQAIWKKSSQSGSMLLNAVLLKLVAAALGPSSISVRKMSAYDVVIVLIIAASPAWTTNFEGEIMGAGGHLHDGGTRLDISMNGKVLIPSDHYE